MKSLLTIMALGMMALVPAAFAADNMMAKDAMMNNDQGKMKAIVFYSDSCGSCKILEPEMIKAMGTVNKDKIDVIKFDFSNAETTTNSYALAKDKNVEALLSEYGSKTGFVILLNDKNEAIGKLTKEDDATAIAGKLTQSMLSMHNG